MRLKSRQAAAPSRRALVAGALALGLDACGRGAPPKPKAAAQAAEPGSLSWALAGPWRTAAERQKDQALHPAETLTFFGLQPSMTVVEIWPGAGWWTRILAPYLKRGKGKLYAATFEVPNPADPAATPVVAAYRKMIADQPDLYGDLEITTFGPHSGALAPAGAADLVLFFNLDHWMAAGLAEKAFHDAYVALKPAGVLGVLQVRGEAGGLQDPLAANGAVQEAFVRQMAAEAGFTFDQSSDVNAVDPKAHRPRTLLPGRPVEPDRMTLRFLKRG